MTGRPAIVDDTDAIAARAAELRAERARATAGVECDCPMLVDGCGDARVRHAAVVAYYGSLAAALTTEGLRIEPANMNTSRSDAD